MIDTNQALTTAKAMDTLSDVIDSPDGVPNVACAEAARVIRGLVKEVEASREAKRDPVEEVE